VSTPRTVPCTIVSVISGDTLLLDLRLGFGVRVELPCKLLGIVAYPPDSREGAGQRAELHRAMQSLAEQPGPLALAFTSHEFRPGEAHGQLIVTDAQGARHDLAAAVTVGDG